MALPAAVKGVAGVRLAAGAVAVLLPRVGIKVFGFPADDANGSTLAMAGMFGVREAVLGGLTLGVADDLPPAKRRRLFQLNALVDAVDASVMLAVAVKHPRLRRPALLVLPLALASVAGHLQAAQQIGDPT